MADFHSIGSDTTVGTVGGTLLTIAVHFDAGDIVRTMVLASIGAFVSFAVSFFCKWVWKSIMAWWKKDNV